MKTTPTTTARSSKEAPVDHSNEGKDGQPKRVRPFNDQQPILYPQPEDQDPEVSRTTDDPPMYGAPSGDAEGSTAESP
ncbi:MAG: hypothetical protein AAGB22_15920 [Bacteroidota bacterium]